MMVVDTYAIYSKANDCMRMGGCENGARQIPIVR